MPPVRRKSHALAAIPLQQRQSCWRSGGRDQLNHHRVPTTDGAKRWSKNIARKTNREFNTAWTYAPMAKRAAALCSVDPEHVHDL
jgi:hypothetical protein